MASFSTTKQRKIAKLIIENSVREKPLTGGEIVENSGYGKSMSLYPKRVIETEGVKKALADYGFNEENAMKVVSEIMLNEDVDANTRLKATDQVFKVRGTYAPEKRANVNMNVDIPKDDTALHAIRDEYEQKLKASLQKYNEMDQG